MSNRFTDTKKWEKSWFCSLSPQYKLLWAFLCDNCNIAGIWNVNWPLVKFYTWLEGPIDPADFGVRDENKLPRVIEMSTDKWMINGFIEYQQKIKSLEDLNPKNNAHLGIINILEREGLGRGYPASSMPLTRGYGNGKGKGSIKNNNNKKYNTNTAEVVPAVVEVKETLPQQFVRLFGQVYTNNVGQIFKTDTKHFVLATKLIKQYGMQAVTDKTALLAQYCSRADVWFVKDGWGNFTIETLSARWNNLLPQQRLSPDELKRQKLDEEYKKLEENNAKYNEIVNAGRKAPGRGQPGPAVHPPGQAAAGGQENPVG